MLRACPCGGRISDDVCDRCGPIKKDKRAKSAWKQGYNTEWDKLRESHLRKHPLCVCCLAQGRTTGGRGRHGLRVDHIQPAKLRSDRFLDPENLNTLCLACDTNWKMPIERRSTDPLDIAREWAELLAMFQAETAKQDLIETTGGE